MGDYGATHVEIEGATLPISDEQKQEAKKRDAFGTLYQPGATGLGRVELRCALAVLAEDLMPRRDDALLADHNWQLERIDHSIGALTVRASHRPTGVTLRVELQDPRSPNGIPF